MDAADLDVLHCALASILLMATWKQIEQATMTLEMNDRERRVIGFILKFGQKARWVSIVSGDVVRDISCILYWHEKTVRRAIADLKVKQWVLTGEDLRGRPYIALTKRYFLDCELEADLMHARRALVSRNWGEIPDRAGMREILSLSETMPHAHFNDKVRQAAQQYLTKPKPKDKFVRTSNSRAKTEVSTVGDNNVLTLDKFVRRNKV